MTDDAEADEPDDAETRASDDAGADASHDGRADASDDAETDAYHTEYDHHTEYDPERERPSLVVVRAVGTLTGQEPGEMPPLAESVPPESLDDLFRPTEKDGLRGGGRVEFEYHGFRVTVSGEGSVEIRPN